MDLRGHGKSSTENDLDLSIEVYMLVNYLIYLLNIPSFPQKELHFHVYP